MTKKVYNPEFKQTIVSLYESGTTVSELCKEFGISTASVNRWKLQYSNTKPRTDISSLDEQKRIKSLEKELKEVKLERDILKKAVGIFSKSDK
jgi:transposase